MLSIIPCCMPPRSCLPKPFAFLSPSLPQVEFRARRIPRHVREARFEAIMAAYEASRLAARVKAEMARERVAKAIQDEQRRR